MNRTQPYFGFKDGNEPADGEVYVISVTDKESFDSKLNDIRIAYTEVFNSINLLSDAINALGTTFPVKDFTRQGVLYGIKEEGIISKHVPPFRPI